MRAFTKLPIWRIEELIDQRHMEIIEVRRVYDIDNATRIWSRRWDRHYWLPWFFAHPPIIEAIMDEKDFHHSEAHSWKKSQLDELTIVCQELSTSSLFVADEMLLLLTTPIK